MSDDTRSCTCYPSEAPIPCQRRYALSDCRRAALVEKACSAWGSPEHDALARMRASAAVDIALEEAAQVAEGNRVEAAGDEYQSDKPGSFWDRESIYGVGHIDAAAAIRALKACG